MGEVRQQLKDWTIPEFKAEIFARFAKIENELGKLNGERIGKIEKNVCELRDSHTRLKQTWTVLSIIGTIIAAVIGLVIGLWEARK
jgi:archaellum component FlaC